MGRRRLRDTLIHWAVFTIVTDPVLTVSNGQVFGKIPCDSRRGRKHVQLRGRARLLAVRRLGRRCYVLGMPFVAVTDN